MLLFGDATVRRKDLTIVLTLDWRGIVQAVLDDLRTSYRPSKFAQ